MAFTSDDDPHVGFLADGVTPVYQSLVTRMLYYLAPRPVRYVSCRQVEFLQAPTAPVPQPGTRGAARA
jgi:hypothetical protein